MKKMNCFVTCPFFPKNQEITDWEYDKNGLKRRKNSNFFICGYDGHIITSWYEECPKNKTEENNESN